jgi:hypothetical protein
MKTFVAMAVAGLAMFSAQDCKASEPPACKASEGHTCSATHDKPAPARQKGSEHAHHHPAVSRVEVNVSEKGYTPSVIEAKAGEPLTLVFKRTTDKGCGQELVFPGLDIRRPLPLNQEVEIEVTPRKGQSIAFTCGMNMYKGRVEAR